MISIHISILVWGKVFHENSDYMIATVVITEVFVYVKLT